MSEVHANPRPASHVEGLGELPALQLLDYHQLKKLRSTSRSIRALGMLWGISGLASAYFGAMMLSSPGDKPPMGLFLLPYGLVVAALGPYCAWARPGWGRWVCMGLSILSLGNLPYGTLLGVLSLIALSRAQPLFGDNQIPHQAVEAAFKDRNG